MQHRLSTLGAVLILAVVSACAGRGPSTYIRPKYPEISVIPNPRNLARVAGPPFRITAASAIVADTTSIDARRAASTLVAFARPSTGYVLPIVANLDSVDAAVRAPADTNRRTIIRLRLTTDTTLGAEGYTLTSDADSVVISASAGAGLFHGVQTLRQLLPFGIDSHQSAIQMGPWEVPAVRISDMPSYGWRGSMLDVARHFFTPDEVKQYIDILALYKLNMFHLHLSDDQGWRIEIKSHPELTALGSGSEVGGGPGGYFTQADYTDLVKYAQDRYITIVPEVDMPGHINAALISHPELACGRLKPLVFTGISGGFNAMCPDSAGSFALVEDIIREIAGMTPGPYFHVGGDEVQGLTKEQYAAFITRVQGIVEKNGKRMIGWDEIAPAALDSTTIIQMWQSDSLKMTVPSTTQILFSAAPRLYLDMKYTPLSELGLRWAGYNDLQKAYDWDPATAIKGTGQSRILGLEAPLWSETPRNITAVEYLVMPRLPAVAEVAWSPASRRTWDDFRLRLSAQAPRWNILGINYYRSAQIVW